MLIFPKQKVHFANIYAFCMSALSPPPLLLLRTTTPTTTTKGAVAATKFLRRLPRFLEIAYLPQIQTLMALYAPCSCIKTLSMNSKKLSSFSELDSWVLKSCCEFFLLEIHSLGLEMVGI